jgi:hypothetical protein
MAYRAIKYFRHAGRVLGIAGIAIDAHSVVVASHPLRRATEVVAGWATAWVGCKAVGAGGAALGSLASPLGVAVGGLGGCVIGGIGGYCGGSMLAGRIYYWAEETIFFRLPETNLR